MLVNRLSEQDQASASLFAGQLEHSGIPVIYNKIGYQAIRRWDDEVYDEDFGGLTRRTTFEFWADQAPPVGKTFEDTGQMYRVEGVVFTKPWSKRLAVSEVS